MPGLAAPGKLRFAVALVAVVVVVGYLCKREERSVAKLTDHRRPSVEAV